MIKYTFDHGKVEFEKDGDVSELYADAMVLVMRVYEELLLNGDLKEALKFRLAVTEAVLTGKCFELDLGDIIAENPQGDLKALIDKALKGDKGNE